VRDIGPKIWAFHALHGEQWQEGSDGDDHRKEDRFVDFNGGDEDAAKLLSQPALSVSDFAVHVVGKMAEDVLHHNDGAVDNDAEIDCADRQ
jgi:hypothetical protein